MSAALPLPPQAPATSEQLAAVLRAVRVLTPGAHTRTRFEVSAAWSMLASQLQAYRLVAHIPADSGYGRVPRDLRAAHALWSEVREATARRLTQEAAGHARGGSGLAVEAVMRHARSDASATEIRWDRVVQNWSLPFVVGYTPTGKPKKKTFPVFDMEQWVDRLHRTGRGAPGEGYADATFSDRIAEHLRSSPKNDAN